MELVELAGYLRHAAVRRETPLHSWPIENVVPPIVEEMRFANETRNGLGEHRGIRGGRHVGRSLRDTWRRQLGSKGLETLQALRGYRLGAKGPQLSTRTKGEKARAGRGVESGGTRYV